MNLNLRLCRHLQTRLVTKAPSSLQPEDCTPTDTGVWGGKDRNAPEVRKKKVTNSNATQTF